MSAAQANVRTGGVAMDWVKRLGKDRAAVHVAHQGIRFHLAALRALEGRAERGGSVEWLPMPAVVCAAFACEMYIKALLIREAGTTPRHHKLSELFSRLSTEAQQEAVRAFGPGNLVDRLIEHSDAFQKYRYIFEEEFAVISHGELLNIAAALLEPVTTRIGVGREYAAKISAQREWLRV